MFAARKRRNEGLKTGFLGSIQALPCGISVIWGKSFNFTLSQSALMKNGDNDKNCLGMLVFNN